MTLASLCPLSDICLQTLLKWVPGWVSAGDGGEGNASLTLWNPDSGQGLELAKESTGTTPASLNPPCSVREREGSED